MQQQILKLLKGYIILLLLYLIVGMLSVPLANYWNENVSYIADLSTIGVTIIGGVLSLYIRFVLLDKTWKSVRNTFKFFLWLGFLWNTGVFIERLIKIINL